MKKYLTSENVLRLFFAFFVGAFLFFLITARWHLVMDAFGGIFVIGLFWLIRWRFQLFFPAALKIYLGVFTFGAMFLGEVEGFYYRYSFWDNMLHYSSGFVVAALGFSLVDLPKYRLPDSMKSVFAFAFSMMVGAFWEIFEFSMDFFFSSNMQKFMDEAGNQFTGQLALMDTMQDLLECAAGALLLLCLVFLKRKYKWGLLDKFLVKKSDF